jgi:hypothetical protein
MGCVNKHKMQPSQISVGIIVIIVALLLVGLLDDRVACSIPCKPN